MTDISSNPVFQSNSSDIDKLTLELLINKKQYSKYLSQSDPTKYEEHKQYLSKIELYLEKILKMTTELLNEPDKQITTDINTSFNAYVKTCIQYFEMKDYENKHNNVYNEDEDDDEIEEEMLFGKMDDPPKTSSYWGKSIHKTNHMNMFFPSK